MMADYLLIGLTFAVAVVGILWRDPPKRAKFMLILFAFATSGASIYKSREDNQDKTFLQLALTSTLVPSNSDYIRFYSDIGTVGVAFGYNGKNYACHHTEQGLTCFLASSDGTKHGNLVLNKAEVAAMYANQIRGVSNNSKSVALFKKQYTPSVNDEEFLDKVGVLGFHTFYNMYTVFPKDYNYDPSFGVKVIFENATKEQQVVQISPDDISRLPVGSALEAFRVVEQLFRQRFEASTNATGNKP
jgi:hypothetical protein